MNSGARISSMVAILFVTATAQVWTNVFGLKSGGNRVSAVKSDPDGGVWVGGFWVDSLRLFDTSLVTADYADCFVAKTDTAGRISRLLTFGGPGYDQLYDIGRTKNGSVVVTGSFHGSMTAGDSSITAPVGEAMFVGEFGDGPTPRWLVTARALAGKALAVLDNGEIVVAGHMGDTAVFGIADTLFGRGRQDFFVALYSAEGNLRWVRGGGGADDEIIKSINVGSNNALYIAGCFRDIMIFNSDTLRSSSSSFQSFVARLDTAGKTTWILPISSDATAGVEDFAVDKDDNLYATGTFSASLSIDSISLPANNEFEFFLAALTSDGHVRWVRHAEVASGNDIAFGRNNELFVTGNFKRRTTFGNFIVEAVDIEDIFIGNYSSDGTCNWVLTAGGCRSAIGWRIAANQHAIFLAGEVDANRTCASCPMRFGSIEIPYTSEDEGRSFLAVADFTIANGVGRPTGHRQLYFKPANSVRRYFDLSGRELHSIPGKKFIQQGPSGSLARQAVIARVGGSGQLTIDLR